MNTQTLAHLRGDQEDVISDGSDSGADESEADAGENVGVVALTGMKRLSVHRHRGKGTPAGEDATTLKQMIRQTGMPFQCCI